MRPKFLTTELLVYLLSLLSACIVFIYRTIAIILVWSGIWGLSDELIFPDNPFVRYIIVFLAGILMLYADDYSLSELIDIRKIKDHEDEEAEEKKEAEKQ